MGGNRKALIGLSFIGFSLLVGLAALPIVKGLYISQLGRLAHQQSQSSKAARVLDRVIFLDRHKLADLSQETAEILYHPQAKESRLALRIPTNGVLDAAIGVDPLITGLFNGQIHFELAVALSDVDPQVVFRKDIDLSSFSGPAFSWQKVEIDLSEYAGQEGTFIFEKGYSSDHEHVVETLYDLQPTDLMYWRKPHIRPKALADRFNVILISLDTLRADHLHFLGYGRDTSPHLDTLARDGAFFTTVVSQAPWTIPAHLSIFTARYPSVHQGTQPIHASARTWNKTLPTMASILREKGYLTAAFTGRGAISARFGLYRGFDFYNETTSLEPDEAVCGGGDIELVFRKATDWVTANRDRTFFLFVHTYEPHYPYCDDFFVGREGINPSDIIAYRTAKYDGDIRRADGFVGALIDRLGDLGTLDKTIVVITSDHGEDLDPPKQGVRHGHNLYDELVLVPLMFYSPGIIPGGRRVDYQVRSIDILPTVLEYLGFPEEAEFDGTSVKGMIDGDDREPRAGYSEATLYGTDRESIRANGYKYIHRRSYGQLSHPYSQGLPLTPLHELYDLSADPSEQVNLAGHAAGRVEDHQELIKALAPEIRFERPDAGAPDGIEIDQDEELVKRLRSLGYVR